MTLAEVSESKAAVAIVALSVEVTRKNKGV